MVNPGTQIQGFEYSFWNQSKPGLLRSSSVHFSRRYWLFLFDEFLDNHLQYPLEIPQGFLMGLTLDSSTKCSNSGA